MEGRDRHAILLDEDAVLEGVGSANLASGVLALGSHCCESRSGGGGGGRVKVTGQLLRARLNFVDNGGIGGAGRRSWAAMVIRRGQREKRHRRLSAWDSSRERATRNEIAKSLG